MTTDWSFGGEWPFAPRWLDTPDGRLHYVDEGAGGKPCVVLVHGNPTWGFLFRRFVGPLVDAGARVIVPDHLGFGRSDKPDRPEAYSVERHAERLALLLDAIEADGVVLVPHDWGGPIALPWAADHPERLAGLFVLNTFAPRLPGPMGRPLTLRMLRAPLLGELYVRRLDVLTRGFLFRAGVSRPDRLTRDVRRAYRAPHPDAASRAGVLAFPRQVPLRPDDPVARLTARTATALGRRLDGIATELCWGMRDVLFGQEVLDRWLELAPQASVRRLERAGHFVQEDEPESVVPALVRFARGVAAR